MKNVFALLLLCLPLAAHAQADDPVLGLWQTEDRDAVIQFYPCDGQLCGRFYGLKDDSATHPSRDDNNRDPELKKRPLCGLTFLGGFTPSKETGFYSNGWIYSPRHGSTYSAELSLKDQNTLELRGFMFISFLGGSQTWQRIKDARACPLLNQF